MGTPLVSHSLTPSHTQPWPSLTPLRPRWARCLTSSMSKEDLAALVKKMYDNSCAVFGEKFDMEIHNLEMETSESHGTFKIPKLKKVNKFKMMGDEEEAK